MINKQQTIEAVADEFTLIYIAKRQLFETPDVFRDIIIGALEAYEERLQDASELEDQSKTINWKVAEAAFASGFLNRTNCIEEIDGLSNRWKLVKEFIQGLDWVKQLEDAGEPEDKNKQDALIEQIAKKWRDKYFDMTTFGGIGNAISHAIREFIEKSPAIKGDGWTYEDKREAFWAGSDYENTKVFGAFASAIPFPQWLKEYEAEKAKQIDKPIQQHPAYCNQCHKPLLRGSMCEDCVKKLDSLANQIQ